MGDQKVVLVVDDDATVHFLSRKILGELNCINQVYSAFNGVEALKIIEDACNGRIDLPEIILLDLHMPLMNGFQLLDELHQMDCIREKKITTIMLSSDADIEVVLQAKGHGVTHFLEKPIMLEKVQSIIGCEV